MEGFRHGTAGHPAGRWWSATAARDQTLADLKKEQGITAELRAGVTTQNAAILAQATLAREAEVRGLSAQQAAAATSCADAMPYVDQLLEKIL